MANSLTAGNHEASDVRNTGQIARVLIIGLLGCVLLIQLVGSLEDPPPPFNDSAVRNLYVQIGCLMAATTAWFWFCFRSRYPRWLRHAAALAMAVLVSVIGVLVSLGMLHFSGSLTPQLTTRELENPPVVNAAACGQTDLSATTTDDFPQFLGPERNSWISGPVLARDWQSHPPRKLWRRPIGAGWSAFAAVNGYAVTLEQRGGEELVVCYSIESGEPVWSHGIVGRHETALGGVGPRSTPTIAAGRVYALGATGILQCLNGGDGTLVWSIDLRGMYGLSASEDEQRVMFGRSASPLVVGSLVVVPGGGRPGKVKNLVAFDCETGRLAWESECKLPGGEADLISYSSPALVTLAGRQQILIVNESTVSGHDPATGRCLWSHPWPGKSNSNASASQAAAVSDNQVLLTKGYGGGAELLELATTGSGEISVSSLWNVPRVLQTKFCNVVVREGYAYGLSEGILECVDLETGRRCWKRGRYGHGQILGVNDLLLVLAEDGELNLLELNPKKFEHFGSIQPLQGKTWNNLCLYGKRILVRNAEEAACYELP